MNETESIAARPAAEDRVEVSFAVPAHDEEALIERAVRSIVEAAEALGVAFEVVVANDASTDETGAIAARAGARVIDVDHRQIAASRNAAARASTGALVIFVDGDSAVNPPLIRAAVDAWRGGAVGGGAGVRFDGRVGWHWRAFTALFLFSFRVLKLPAGCFVFCRRDAFDAVGGFDERRYCGEEVYFGRALKRRGRFVVLRECVLTSGRKLRTHSAWELIRALVGIACRPWRSKRRHDLWYGPRRPDREG